MDCKDNAQNYWKWGEITLGHTRAENFRCDCLGSGLWSHHKDWEGISGGKMDWRVQGALWGDPGRTPISSLIVANIS